MGITAEEVVLRGGIEIDFYVKLVGIESLSLNVAEIVLEATTGRGGIEGGTKQSLRHCIDRLGNDVIEKRRVAVPRIIELVGFVSHIVDYNRVVAEASSEPASANIPKVALTFRRGEDVKELRRGGVVKSLPLIVKEEEQLVLNNGTTDGSTEHVPAQLVSLHFVESVFPRVGVQLVIAKKLPEVPMETVCARLNAGTDDATLEVAELGRGILRDKVKLLN